MAASTKVLQSGGQPPQSPANLPSSGSLHTSGGDRPVQMEDSSSSGWSRFWNVVFAAFRSFFSFNWLSSSSASQESSIPGPVVVLSPEPDRDGLSQQSSPSAVIHPSTSSSPTSPSSAAPPKKSVRKKITKTSFDKNKDPFYKEFSGVGQDKKAAVKTIVSTLGDENTTLALHAKSLITEGKKIEDLHPLVFCALIFSDLALIQAFDNIKTFHKNIDTYNRFTKPMMKNRIKPLVEGIQNLLGCEDLADHLPGFCHMMKIELSFVQKRVGTEKGWMEIFAELAKIGRGQPSNHAVKDKEEAVEEIEEDVVVAEGGHGQTDRRDPQSSSSLPASTQNRAKDRAPAKPTEALPQKHASAFEAIASPEKYDSKASEKYWKELSSQSPDAILLLAFKNEPFVGKLQKKKGLHPQYNQRRQALLDDMSRALHAANQTKKIYLDLKTQEDWKQFLKNLSQADLAVRQNPQSWTAFLPKTEQAVDEREVKKANKVGSGILGKFRKKQSSEN